MRATIYRIPEIPAPIMRLLLEREYVLD